MRARGATEALQQLEKVRTELNSAKDPLDDAVHETRKRYCSLVENVLFKDLDFALGRKLEQDLWNVGFRSSISTIQKEMTKERSLRLGHMIDLSAGYFLKLLQRVVHRYRVTELKAIPGPDSLGVIDFCEESELSEEIRITKRSRVLYICQYCLVHLGDLARYRNDMNLAERYYCQAADIDPRNGHPYNQLGLLEGSKGCHLSTVFFYVRSLSVGRPFVVAISNLERIYMKIIQDETTPATKDKMGPTETVSSFLHFIALVHMNQQLADAREILKKLLDSLARLILKKKLDDEKLIMLTTIALFTFNRSNKNPKVTTENGTESVTKLMNEFVFGFFRGALLTNIEAEDENPAVPTILILLEALIANPKSVSLNPFRDLWFILRTVLNSFHERVSVEWKDEALPEDYKLLGFLPLRHVHSKINFNENGQANKQPSELRRSRFVSQGHELCKIKFIDGTNIVSFSEGRFHAEPWSTDENLVKEFNRLKLEKDEPKAAVRFNIDESSEASRREKPKRQNVALQAIMNQRHPPPPPAMEVAPAQFNQPPPPIALKWNMTPPVAAPPPPPMMRPPGPYPMTIEELVKQPPPPIYNVDLRLVHPPPAAHIRPQPRVPPAFAQPRRMVGQSNTYSLFSGGSWNPQMPHIQMPHAGQLHAPPPVGSLVAQSAFSATRPQGGSLWKPDKSAQGTSALERLLNESKKQAKEA